MKQMVVGMLVSFLLLGLAGCNGQLRVREPRQELSVNPVRLDSGMVDVEIKYVVSNPDKNPVTFTFPTSKQWDAWVIANGREVFRESAGKMYTQAFTNLTLQPGESKEFSTTWKLSLASEAYQPGTKFEVHAGLATKDLAPLSVTAVPVVAGD